MEQVLEKKNKKMKPAIIVFATIILVMAVVGITWLVDLSRFVTTDDARVASDNLKISPKIPGKIQTILVQEGDRVSADQILAIMDKTDLTLALDQAKSNEKMAQIRYIQAQEALNVQKINSTTQYKQASAGLTIAQQKLNASLKGRPEDISMAKSKMDAAQVALNMANEDLAKAKKLYNIGAASQHDYAKASDAAIIADKNYQLAKESYVLTENGPRTEDKTIAQQQLEQSQAALDQSKTGTQLLKIKEMELKNAEVAKEQAATALQLAQYNFDNAQIKTTQAGTVAQKTINPGEFTTPGQTIFTIINPTNIWIQANIKETSIAGIKTGSPVDVFLDEYPGQKFMGQVKQIGIAANSNFSVLPLGNSAGNFVKVVQNIPIKIALNHGAPPMQIGASAKIKVHIK